MPRVRDPRSYEEMVNTIKRTARQQMAVNGAASLSLGGIARAMDLSTPALYRYFDSRDALVTALIMDAYAELLAESEAAVMDLHQEHFGARFEALVLAYRRWALTHPQDYVLAHGAVFPGYKVPVDLLVGAVLGTLRLFITLLEEAQVAGVLRIPQPYLSPPPSLHDALAPLEASLPDGGLQAPLVMLAYMTWLRVHALVWQEVGSSLPDTLFADGKVFALEMHMLAESLGLHGEASA